MEQQADADEGSDGPETRDCHCASTSIPSSIEMPPISTCQALSGMPVESDDEELGHE